MYIKLLSVFILIINVSFITSERKVPNRKRWSVLPGEVTEVRLDLPLLIRGRSWTYHIKLSSKDEFIPTMWLGYPIYLPENMDVSSSTECQIPQDVRAFSTHHILKVSFTDEGYFVKMINFLGNETSEVLLANYPEILLFSTQDSCYKREMLVYKSTFQYSPPKVLPPHPRSGLHQLEKPMDHDHDLGSGHYSDDDETRPIHADFYRQHGHGTWGPPTPLDESDGTSWIPVIVIACMIGVFLLYVVARRSCTNNPEDPEDNN